MLPNVELERRYGVERYRDWVREADQWRLGGSFIRPTWLTRQKCWLLCRLGSWLIRMGQYLQANGSLSAPAAHLLKRA
jgi:hypothetical protein